MKKRATILCAVLLLGLIGLWAQQPPGGYSSPNIATPGGTNGQVQFNNNGAFGGSGLTTNSAGTLLTGGSGTLIIASSAGNNMLLQPGAGGVVNLSGGIALNGATPGRILLKDQGSCTMAAGACAAQALGSTYNVAPICMATVITAGGTPATPLRAPSTTTTVTPQTGGATDTSVVGWICLGN